MADFTIKDKSYRSSRFPSLTSMEIARRYSSVLVFIGDVKAKTMASDPDKVTPAGLARALLLAAGELPAADQQFVVAAALGVTFRLEADKAMPVRESTTGRLMFEDIEPAAIAEIVYRVLDDHGLIDFFVDPPRTT